jgi:hypothetical protein
VTDTTQIPTTQSQVLPQDAGSTGAAPTSVGAAPPLTPDPSLVPATPTVSPDPVQANVPTSGTPQKSPLDMLEDILADAQKKDQAKKGEVEAAAKAEAEAKAAAEKAAQEAALEQEKVRQQQEDEALLHQKQEELKTIVETPEYQARVEQQTAEEQKHADETAAGAGFQITQLGHTKIEVDDSQQ